LLIFRRRKKVGTETLKVLTVLVLVLVEGQQRKRNLEAATWY
jgi:hypothetical protein